jgi:hypothetical protein
MRDCAMIDQDNKLVELGPIALELMKLSEDLRVFAETPLFEPHNVANDDAPPAQEQAADAT